MSLRDQARAIAEGIQTVGDARDMLMAAQRTMVDGLNQASTLGAWPTASGETEALASLIDNTRGYVAGVYDSLDAFEDTDPINAIDRQRVGLAVAQTADTVQVISDTLHSPGFAQGFIADLGGSWSTVVHAVAGAAGDLVEPLFTAFWPVWTGAAVVVAVVVWILYANRKLIARIAEKAVSL